MDHELNRARVIRTADICADCNCVIYAADHNAGLCIMEHIR